MKTLYNSSCTIHLFQLSHDRLTADLSLFRRTSCTISVAQSICLSSVWALTLTHKTSDHMQTRFSLSNSESSGLSFGPFIQRISQTSVQLSVLCESSTLSTVSADGPRAPRIAGCRNFRVARIRNRRQETQYVMQLQVCICNIVPFPSSFGNHTKRDRISDRVPLRLMSVILQKMSACSTLKWRRIYSMTPRIFKPTIVSRISINVMRMVLRNIRPW
jgi:hypothetical protein